MSDLLSQVCLAKGVKINPAKVAPAVAKDAELLNDVRALFEQLTIIEKMKGEVSALTFSDEALTILSGASSAVSDPDPFVKNVKIIEATIRTIDGIKSKKKREKLAGDHANFSRMLEIVRRTELKFNAVKKNTSTATQETVGQLYSAEQQSSTTIKLISSLKNAIVNISLKLSPKVKIQLGIGGEGWTGKLSGGKIDQLLDRECRAAELKNDPATQPKIDEPVVPKKPEPARFLYSLRAGGGYGTAADQQGILLGGVSGKLRLGERSFLQLDYMGQLDVANKVKQGTDDAAATYRFTYGQITAGYYRFKDAIAGAPPDMNGAYLRSRFIVPVSKLSLTLDQDLFTGNIANKWQTVGRGEPGVVLNAGRFKPFAGAIVGYDTYKNGMLYGGFAGSGAKLGERHEFDLRIDYTNLYGVGAQGRYFYNTKNWGVGPVGEFVYDLNNKKYTAQAGLMARFQLGRLNFLPYVQGDFADGAKGISAGVLFRWEDTQLAKPTKFRPASFDPLPEAK